MPPGRLPKRGRCRDSRCLRIIGKDRCGCDRVRSGGYALHNLTVQADLYARPPTRALLSFTKEAACATQLQVAARDGKSGTQRALLSHDMQPLERLAAQPWWMHQVGVGLNGSATNTAAQLVELREPQQMLPHTRDRSHTLRWDGVCEWTAFESPLCTHCLLDDDRVGPRNADAALNDGRCHQHVHLATLKGGDAQ